jgi:hypothetical protein
MVTGRIVMAVILATLTAVPVCRASIVLFGGMRGSDTDLEVLEARLRGDHPDQDVYVYARDKLEASTGGALMNGAPLHIVAYGTGNYRAEHFFYRHSKRILPGQLRTFVRIDSIQALDKYMWVFSAWDVVTDRDTPADNVARWLQQQVLLERRTYIAENGYESYLGTRPTRAELLGCSAVPDHHLCGEEEGLRPPPNGKAYVLVKTETHTTVRENAHLLKAVSDLVDRRHRNVF